jgi:uncharacterized repeat protein (TIGR01451 family)
MSHRRKHLLFPIVVAPFITVITLLFMSQTAMTDSSIFTEAVTDPLEGVVRSSVDWGDYDNDGDLDILLTGDANGDYITTIYRNDGADTFTAAIVDTLPGIHRGSASWGDYDNDGDLDILLVGDTGGFKPIATVYRNDGEDTFTDIDAALMGTWSSSAEWGDYDNDGDLDILIAGNSSAGPFTGVYRNDGNDLFTTAITNTLPGVSRSSVTWGDYDDDGDLDILLTGRAGVPPLTAIYRNDGADTFTAAITDTLTDIYWGSAAWGDYDNDGDLDILLVGDGNDDDYVAMIYRNDGANTFTAAVTDTLTGVYQGSADWGDYDNDGDLDVLLTGGSDNAPRTATIYRNDGSDLFTAAVTDTLTGVYESSAAWGDYDNDGDLDILLAGEGQGGYVATIYRNNTTTANATPNAPTGLNAQVAEDRIVLSWAAPSPTCTTPITGLSYNLRVGSAPGLSDALAPMALDDGYRQVAQLGNAGLGLTTTLVLPYGTYYWSVQAVDHTFAGSPFAAEGSFYTGPPPFSEAITDTLTGVSQSAVAWGDYDNDGDLDILLTGDRGSSYVTTVYRNDGSDIFTEAITDTLRDVGKGSVAWGDYNNDGNLDILLAGDSDSGPVTIVYRNDGAGIFTAAVTDTLTGVWGSSVMWGDYDNDGDPDILLSGNSSTGPVTKVYRNDGSDTFTEAITDTLSSVSRSSLAWGDYDNDDDLDILLTGRHGVNPLTIVYRNDGSDTFTAAVTDTLTDIYWGSVAWGDYDNDGDLDILLAGDTGGGYITKIYRNDGADTFTATVTDTLESVYHSSTAWGDYDNDGDLDILLTGDTGSGFLSTVYRNDGANIFTATVTDTLTDVGEGSAAWGDYDNDGDLDILLTGLDDEDTPVATIYRNNAFIANVIPAPPTGLSAQVAGDKVELSWSAPSPTCTTPITALSYNLRVGSAPGWVDTLAPMALGNGYRQVVQPGGTGHGLTATLVLTYGTYYWSVQAVDHTFTGSPFAAEGQFHLGPAITVIKTADLSTAEVGQTITYTYHVTNTGSVYLNNISASDDRLGVIALSKTALTPNEGTNGALTYTVVVGDLPGPLTNTVVVTGTPLVGDDVNATDDLSITLHSSPSITVIKTADVSSAQVGQTITFTYRVTNTGNVSLTNLSASDDRLGAITLSKTTLIPNDGTSGTLTYTVVAGDLPGPLINTVVVTGTPPVGDDVNATDDLSITLHRGPAITVIKTADVSSAEVGQTITYTYRVTNTGSVNLNNISASDDRLGAIALGKTTLTPNEGTSGTLTHTVVAGDLPGPLTNTVVVTGTPPVGDDVNDTDDLSITLHSSPAITVIKTADVNSAQVGQTITYTYRVTNTGDVNLTNLSAFDDRLGAIVLGKTTLAPNEGTSGALTYTVVAGDLPGPLTNTVVVTGTPPLGPAVSANTTLILTLNMSRIYLPLVIMNE